MDFFLNKISNSKDLISEELKRGRTEKHKSINEIGKILGIRTEYLEALENGEYEKLPQGVYGRNFLREYARYLGLDPEKMLEIYGEDSSSKIEERQKNAFAHKVPKALLFVAVPRVLKNVLLIFAVLICLSYLGYYINNIITPPDLKIIYPSIDIAVKESTIIIKGQTDKEAEVTVNGESVLADIDGVFEKVVSLKSGLNTITVKSQKKYSRPVQVERKILLEL
jgi:transcriptional regulator with XRE-family HTH domain